MSKAYLLVICLLITSFTGCMDGENLEKTTDTDVNEEIEDDEVIEPVGTDNLSSLEKRISELEDKIEEYESLKERISELENTIEEYESLKDNLSNLEETIGSGGGDPVIYFMEFEDTDYRWTRYAPSNNCGPQFNCTNLYEGDNFLFCYTGSNEREYCRLSLNTYDTDGVIVMISFSTTEGNLSNIFIEDPYHISVSCTDNFYRVFPNNTIGCIIYPYNFSSINVCALEPVNQTITVRAYDNDGNSAEAEYYLDYDAVCNAPFGR